MKASEVFRNAGKNFVTPEIIEYGWVTDDVAYELSTGSRFLGHVPFGVTFRHKGGDDYQPDMNDLSSNVDSVADGRRYIEQVRERLL